MSNGTLALVWRLLAAILTRVHEKEEKRFFASRTVNPIEALAKQSYVFKTYLKGDDITMQYKGGVVTLTGTVSDESHKLLAQEIISNLPGFKMEFNNMIIERIASMTN